MLPSEDFQTGPTTLGPFAREGAEEILYPAPVGDHSAISPLLWVLNPGCLGNSGDGGLDG